MAANSDDPAPPADPRPGNGATADAEGAPSRAEILEALQNVQARLSRCEQEIARMNDPKATLRGERHRDDGHEPRPPSRQPRRRSRTSRWVWPLLLILVLIAALAGGAVWLVDDIRESVSARVDQAGRAVVDALPGDDREDDAAPSRSPTAEETTAAAGSDAGPDNAGEPAGIVPEARVTGGPAVEAAPATPVEVVELESLDAALAPLPDDAPSGIRTTAEMAMSGDPDAQHDLATLYALGHGIPHDDERAAFWFRLAADAGIANAQYNLGVLMHHGRGVPQDRAAAFTLFREAAESGHSEAQIAVGQAWRYGRGVERNPVRAASWFQAANAGGNPYGAWYLGQMYEGGIDGAPDLSAAAGWYRLAAEGGIEEAEEALARLAAESEEIASADGPAEDSGRADPDAVPVPSPAGEPAPVPADGAAPEELGREDIRAVQQLLAELGYEPGPEDGLMGDRTAAAIREFQTEEGLTVTGQPTPALLARLRAAAGSDTGDPDSEPGPDQTN